MTRGVDHAQTDLPELQLVAIVQRIEREIDVGRLVQAKPGAGRIRQLSITGHVISMEMSVNDQSDLVATLVRQVDVRFDVQLRIDDRRLPGLPRGNEIGSTASLVVKELLEVHV